MSDTVRISLWSGPRNVSTALMYSFAQRSDTRVYDEPLYAHYLSRTSARFYHPGAEEVLRSQEQNGEKVVRELLLGPSPHPVLFFKNMTHHLVELDWHFLMHLKNVILTRDPREMLPSYAKQVEEPSLRDTGYAVQVEILEFLDSRGCTPLVLDAGELLLNPWKVLTELCDRLGLEFQEEMLEWKAGPRPEDGVWARYWYENVHRSSGFQPYRPKIEPFPPRLRPLLDECLPCYERLRARALKADG